MNIEDIERLLKSGKRMGTTKKGCYIAGALDARDEFYKRADYTTFRTT